MAATVVQRDVEEKGNQEREINKNKMRKQKTHCTAETKNDRYQAVLHVLDIKHAIGHTSS